ncbi:MAG TPA: glycosyl hydrolase family 28-related protein [Prolixibacteraceae bacterium]|nr:glycosyl hydrolase family 28-related protein [Prolixibacteraceae bacterium]
MHKLILTLCLIAGFISLKGAIAKSASFYPQKPEDAEAVYFTPDNFTITADGKTDVSEQLQEAINQLKKDCNFGILFIPEGTYLISKTIYIPAAIRVIGYGKTRPLVVLKKNSPGFQNPDPNDKGQASYMFWFTSSIVEPGKGVNDASAGTFYSSLSNIDLKIEDGNPAAVALRTHYAQHSFVAHCDIQIGNGKAGLFDVGNFMEDVRFYGGDYGIYTTKASPGWQFMMMDTWFEGQRKAAIRTQEAGFTIVRMNVKNVPSVLSVDENYWEKLILEDSRFENVSGPAIQISNEDNANTQINIRNLVCSNVPVLVRYPKTEAQTPAPGAIYRVNRYVYGLQINDLKADAAHKITFEHEVLKVMPATAPTDIPQLPTMATWVNLKTLGAKGDGLTDDTKAIQQAIEQYPTIYVPQGSYRISETLKLKPNTVLIGLHPMATNFALVEDAPAFGSFGAPKAMVEAPQGGTNIISGIGLYTAENNYRAVACKWMAGEKSMVDDVKLIGGHGTMRPGPKVQWKWEERQQAQDRRSYGGSEQVWYTQYWSLWVTNNGGGIFKNIWSASTFATSGFYANNTTTRGRIYAMSVEHHVRNEVRFKNVSNWKVYALQLEEESRESSECQPMEIEQCKDMTFANLYMFRVIRVKVPYPYSVRTWDCSNIELLNVHNYSQIKYTTDNPLYDINTNTEVRPVEFARLLISGNTPKISATTAGPIQLLGKGFEFALGACSDSKGNVYFAEQRMKRVYKYSSETNSLSMVADFPWEPMSLACDSKDNLLVVFRYNPQPGYMVNGEQEKYPTPADASGTSYSMWGNAGFGTLAYSIDPRNPEETIQPLKKVPMGSVNNVYKALYPSNRWRDWHDFNTVSVNRNEECWLAPDGKTIIPVCYDLARSCALVEAFPGKPLLAVDEYDKRTVKLDVDAKGYLSNLKYYAEKGEFSAVIDASGKLYVADGEIYIFDKDGKSEGILHTPERPSTLTFGGKDGKTLFITGRTALYSTTIK